MTPLKHVSPYLVTSLLVLNLVVLVQLWRTQQKVDVVYLAQQRAEAAAETWFQKGRSLEVEKRYREAQDAYHRAKVDERNAVSKRAERAFQSARAHEILHDPSQLDPSTIQQLIDTLTTLGGVQKELAVALDIMNQTNTVDPSAAINRVKDLYGNPRLSQQMCGFLGNALVARKRAKTAVSLLRDCTLQLPKAANLWGLLSDALDQVGQTAESIEAMERSLDLQFSENKKTTLARLLMRQKRWQAAIDSLQTLPKDKALKAQQLRLIAACHYQLKAFSRAADTYQKAYDIVEDPQTLLSKAIALQSDGRSSAAIRTLNTLDPFEAELPTLHFLKGQLYVNSKQLGNAAQSFRHFLRVKRDTGTDTKQHEQARNWLAWYSQRETTPKSQSRQTKPTDQQPMGAPSNSILIQPTSPK